MPNSLHGRSLNGPAQRHDLLGFRSTGCAPTGADLVPTHLQNCGIAGHSVHEVAKVDPTSYTVRAAKQHYTNPLEPPSLLERQLYSFCHFNEKKHDITLELLVGVELIKKTRCLQWDKLAEDRITVHPRLLEPATEK